MAIPAMLYIAMGTRDTRPELQAFMEKCVDNPAYGVAFYQRKIITQWNVPMYLCLVMTNKIVEEQTPFAESVYFGEAGKWMILLILSALTTIKVVFVGLDIVEEYAIAATLVTNELIWQSS